MFMRDLPQSEEDAMPNFQDDLPHVVRHGLGSSLKDDFTNKPFRTPVEMQFAV
jgi:hypothetical protein